MEDQSNGENDIQTTRISVLSDNMFVKTRHSGGMC